MMTFLASRSSSAVSAADTGTTVQFTNNYSVPDASKLVGAGTYELTNGTLSTGGSLNVTTFNQTNGTLAGTLTLTIQMTADDGTTWCTLATAETSGNTSTINATGGYHITTTVPIGTRTRLAYTIATGPFAFTVVPVYGKTGTV